MTVEEKRSISREFPTYKIESDPESDLLIDRSSIERQARQFVYHFVKELPKLHKPIFIWLRDGAEMFSQDLQTAFKKVMQEVEFVGVNYKLYEGMVARAQAELDETEFPFPDVAGRAVILVDDVADTIKTAHSFIGQVQERGGTVTDAVFMVEKPESSPWRSQIREKPWPKNIRKWSLFAVDDLWLQGNGMDTNGIGREDPNVIWRRDMEPQKVEYFRRKRRGLPVTA